MLRAPTTISATLALALALLGCPSDEPDPVTPPGCGNGLVEDGEQCDDGDANSDTAPDACRTLCLLPSCGDGVADTGEECDDGTPWGGDGCTPLCTAEAGQLESEPNDRAAEAEAWEGGTVHGALPADDADCFSFEMVACSAVEARLVGECPAPAVLALYDADHDEVAVGSPGADGCAVLDPAEAPGARFVEEGAWSLCVRGLMDGAVPFYALEITLVDPEDATYPIPDHEDPDGDGKPDRCDADRDGDGVDNDDDNCPDIPNGPDTGPLTPSDSGFLRQWLTAGPYTGFTTETECLPSDYSLIGEDEASAAPALGDPAGESTWVVLWSTGDRLNFLPTQGHVEAPRENYTAVYVHSAAERELTLAIGPDDGAYVWFNGVQVMNIPDCQGTSIDKFQEPVTLEAGWNRLLIKVYDQYGGWGNYVRFLDADGDPVTALEISLSPDGPWESNQVDSDGDGEGDVCDDTP